MMRERWKVLECPTFADKQLLPSSDCHHWADHLPAITLLSVCHRSDQLCNQLGPHTDGPAGDHQGMGGFWPKERGLFLSFLGSTSEQWHRMHNGTHVNCGFLCCVYYTLYTYTYTLCTIIQPYSVCIHWTIIQCTIIQCTIIHASMHTNPSPESMRSSVQCTAFNNGGRKHKKKLRQIWLCSHVYVN